MGCLDDWKGGMGVSRFWRVLMGLVLVGAAVTLTRAQLGGGFGGGGVGGDELGLGGFGGRGVGGFGGGAGGGRSTPGRYNQALLQVDPEGFPVMPADRDGVPRWEVNPRFKKDVFTFVRLRFQSGYDDRMGSGRVLETWATDFPDSDINLPFRLQQMTSLKVDPDGKRIRITDPALFDYPFVYMLEVGMLKFSEEEVVLLRRYLLNGGFLMVDDHWGLAAEQNFREQMARVFPDRPMKELPLDHPIFHCVFDLQALPQIPGINEWMQRRRTFEKDDDPVPHYRALFDDKRRMMMIECANTDLGDGWEREGVNEEFFHLFSEKQAYPMGINIIFYAMTH